MVGLVGFASKPNDTGNDAGGLPQSERWRWAAWSAGSDTHWADGLGGATGSCRLSGDLLQRSSAASFRDGIGRYESLRGSLGEGPMLALAGDRGRPARSHRRGAQQRDGGSDGGSDEAAPHVSEALPRSAAPHARLAHARQYGQS